MSLKAEYQRIDLGSSHLAGSAVADGGEDQANASLATDHSYDTFRVGLNYHFYRNAYEPLK